jgi:hypothetical protein
MRKFSLTFLTRTSFSWRQRLAGWPFVLHAERFFFCFSVFVLIIENYRMCNLLMLHIASFLHCLCISIVHISQTYPVIKCLEKSGLSLSKPNSLIINFLNVPISHGRNRTTVNNWKHAIANSERRTHGLAKENKSVPTQLMRNWLVGFPLQSSSPTDCAPLAKDFIHPFSFIVFRFLGLGCDVCANETPEQSRVIPA